MLAAATRNTEERVKAGRKALRHGSKTGGKDRQKGHAVAIPQGQAQFPMATPITMDATSAGTAASCLRVSKDCNTEV